jgi:hypothetical protein
VRTARGATGVPHPRAMTSEPTLPQPGSLTVPPLFGWQEIAVVLVLLVVLGCVFLVVATTRSGSVERSEWQAWLAARSRARGPASEAARPAAPAGTRSAGGRSGRPRSSVGNA